MAKLDEDQRKWLDQALQNKGRFTRANSVRKDWDDYVRRREKAAMGGAGLLPDDPRKKPVDEGLKRADELAKAGKFAEAYKSLDAIKKMGAQASVERARAVSIGDLNARLNIVRSAVGDSISLCDFATGFYDPLFDKIATMTPASQKKTLSAAALRQKEIGQEQQVLLGEMAGREDWVHRAVKKVNSRQFLDELSEIDRDITVHVVAGHQDQVREYADRAAQVRQDVTSHTFVSNAGFGSDLVTKKRGLFEEEMRRLKDISKFRDVNAGQQEPDPKTGNIRSWLEETDGSDVTEEREKALLSKAGAAMKRAGLRDRVLETRTVDPLVNKAAEVKSFDPSAVFDKVISDLFGGGEVPDDIPFDKAEEIKKLARTRLRDELKAMDPAGDQLFDLMVSTQEELQSMCNRGLTGIDSPKGLSQSHQKLLPELAKGLKEEILKNSPNKMSPDAKSITVNGKKYTLDSVVGEGANGAIRRYTDGEKTFVVKSLKGSMNAENPEEKFQKMSEEMRTHRQLMTGADDGVTDTDHIIQMQGGAVSEDGSLHMIMEEAEGGDMSSVGNNLVMMQQLGVIPDEARQVLALDMIVQSVKGMKAMQERGLVQNDLKPQNIMITKDGTVKIIDFGESRFLDDETGKIEGAMEGGYGTTPGFEAPEHYGHGTQVDAKADTFALGGIIKTLMDPGMSQNAVTRDQNDVTALGRLTSALTDQDPSKRPSLDAVLMSSLLDDMAKENNPEDVKDLQKAASEMNVVLKSVKAGLTAQELNDNVPDGKGVVDGTWVPYLTEGMKNGTEVPVMLLNTMVTRLDDEILRRTKNMNKGSTGDVQDARATIEKLTQQKKFWMAKLSTEIDKARTEGKQEIDDVVNDEFQEMLLSGPSGGQITLAEAVKRRDENIMTIERMQKEFYQLASTDPQKAQQEMVATNTTLQELDKQVQDVNAEVQRAVGPKGKYVLAEKKLNEVSMRFGPTGVRV